MTALAMQMDHEPVGLWARLKAATREVHEGLDQRIMAARPFESRDRYGLFLLTQYDFHSIVGPLFHNPDLGRLLPDLAGRNRLALIAQDLRDLEISVPGPAQRHEDYLLDVPASIGWLYVAEGSNLGAAFLLKAAAKLGLSEQFGARHLAGAPEGRGLHWRTFTTALDALGLSPEEEARAMDGANQAFAAVRGFAERHFS